jgi:hypothetical protein
MKNEQNVPSNNSDYVYYGKFTSVFLLLVSIFIVLFLLSIFFPEYRAIFVEFTSKYKNLKFILELIDESLLIFLCMILGSIGAGARGFVSQIDRDSKGNPDVIGPHTLSPGQIVPRSAFIELGGIAGLATYLVLKSNVFLFAIYGSQIKGASVEPNWQGLLLGSMVAGYVAPSFGRKYLSFGSEKQDTRSKSETGPPKQDTT